MAEERIARTILQLTLDKRAAKETTEAVQDLQGELRKLVGASDAAGKSGGALSGLGSAVGGAFGKVSKSAGELGRSLGPLAGALGGAAGEAVRAAGDIADIAEKVPELTSTLAGLGPVALAGGVAVGALALAFGELQKQSELAKQAILDQIEASKKRVESERTVKELVEAGDLEGAKKRIDDLKKANEDANITLTEQYQRINEINKALEKQDDLTLGQLAALNSELAIREADRDALYKDFKARADEQSAIEAALPAIAEHNKLLKGESDVLKDLQSAGAGIGGALGKGVGGLFGAIGKAAENFTAEQQRRDQALVKAQQSFNDDRDRLTNSALEDTARLYDEYNQKLVDLATAAADAADAALQKLTERRAELASQFAADQLNADKQLQLDRADLALSQQRDEAQAARDHARTLQSIRERAADSELKSIADRDFQSLFFSRRETNRALREESQRYADEQADRRLAYSQQLQDLNTQFERDKAARDAKYVQDLADAQLQYEKEQTAITANLDKQRQLTQQGYAKAQGDLQTAVTKQLAVRQQQYNAELQMATQTAQAIAQTFQGLLGQAQANLQSLSSFGAGIVNNNSSASFNQTNNFQTGTASPQNIANVVFNMFKQLIPKTT